VGDFGFVMSEVKDLIDAGLIVPPLVPTFEVASNPTVRLSEIKGRRFYIVDRSQAEVKKEYIRYYKETYPDIDERWGLLDL
jgi:hypothetical protein